MKLSKDAPLWAAASAALAFPLLLPIYNPDLYWHLSAGRRIAELGAIPKTDWLSSARAGAPWIDFEWLAQVVYHGAWSLGGFFGLWLLKALLVAALARLVYASIRLHAPDSPLAAGALAVWAAAYLPFADLRPDVFSALGFSALVLALERERLGRGRVHPGFALPLFALWANLHGGWPYGLALLVLYRKWAALALAAAGVCLQPGGPASIAVVLAHGRDLALVGRHLNEWKPFELSNVWVKGVALCVAAAAFAAGAAASRKKKLGVEPALGLAVLAAAAMRHARLALFFPLLAAGPAAGWARSVLAPAAARQAAWLLCAGAIVCAAPVSLDVGTFRRVLRPLGVEGAADHLSREKARLGGGRAVYAHAWHWGSYLGWRLYPEYRPFGDGRYLFHDLVDASRRATSSPEAWAAFLKENALELVILERAGPVYQVNGEPTPYWKLFMPPKDWALEYEDDRALLFARRQRGDKRR